MVVMGCCLCTRQGVGGVWCVVLDEADRLLEMGFKEEVKQGGL